MKVIFERMETTLKLLNLLKNLILVTFRNIILLTPFYFIECSLQNNEQSIHVFFDVFDFSDSAFLTINIFESLSKLCGLLF